jgi:hypothetical protein
MRFVFTVRCGSDLHEIELKSDGTLVPLNHDLTMIAAFTAFGATKPACLEVIESWEKGPERFFEVDSVGRAFSDTFWEQYEAWDDDEIEDLPLEFLPKDKFVDTLIHLLRYAIEEEETDHARILGELLYEHVDSKKDVELIRNVKHDDSGNYERTYVYDNRILKIKDIKVAAWTLASDRYVYDPFTFQSQVEEAEINDMPGGGGETPWAVIETLEALHIEEPEAAEPGPTVDVEFCPEGEECEYAVVFIGDFGLTEPTCFAVQYKNFFNASEGLEASTSLLENWGVPSKSKSSNIISMAVRRSPHDRKEFDDKVRAMELALTQKAMFKDVPLSDPELQALAEMDDDELELRRTWHLLDDDEVETHSEAARKKAWGGKSYGGW